MKVIKIFYREHRKAKPPHKISIGEDLLCLVTLKTQIENTTKQKVEDILVFDPAYEDGYITASSDEDLIEGINHKNTIEVIYETPALYSKSDLDGSKYNNNNESKEKQSTQMTLDQEETKHISLSPIRRELVQIVKGEFQKLQSTLRIGVSFTPSTYTERYKSLNAQTIPPWFSPGMVPTTVATIGKSKKLVSIFAYPPEAGSSETTVVQPWWNDVIDCLPETLPVELTDEHKHPTIGNRKPDIIGWQRGKTHSSFYIAIVGELKARRSATTKEEFDADEMGQLESFMQDLIENFQPHRSEITAFLSDGKLIQFFRLQYSGTWKFQQTPVYNMEEQGGQYLMGLLASSPTSLGMSPELCVNNTPITIESVLGLGGSSVVFKGTYHGEQVVVKHFRPNCKARLIEEERNLNLINAEPSLKNRTTELVAVTDDQTALLVRPVGIQFITTLLVDDPEKRFASSKHFAEVIDIIQITHHKLQLVHRDLTLSNFFLLLNDTVFLNDWGCAVKIGSVTTFSGSLILAPRRVLEGMQNHGLDFKYSPQESDDLEMIVKCFFGRMNAVFHTLPVLSSDNIKNDAAILLKFWDVQLAPDFWRDWIAMATKMDYDGLKKGIKSLLA